MVEKYFVKTKHCNLKNVDVNVLYTRTVDVIVGIDDSTPQKCDAKDDSCFDLNCTFTQIGGIKPFDNFYN